MHKLLLAFEGFDIALETAKDREKKIQTFRIN